MPTQFTCYLPPCFKCVSSIPRGIHDIRLYLAAQEVRIRFLEVRWPSEMIIAQDNLKEIWNKLTDLK